MFCVYVCVCMCLSVGSVVVRQLCTLVGDNVSQ